MTQDQEARRTKDSGVRYGIHQIHNNEVVVKKGTHTTKRKKEAEKHYHDH